MMDVSYTAPPEVDRIQQRALMIGIISLVISVVLAVFNPGRFFFSYLVSFFFLTGISVGSLAIAMLHQMSGGNWGVVIRRLLESATRTLPLLAVLFLPVIVGARFLYEWARPDAVAVNAILQYKHPYLNIPFFIGRTVFYFAVWLTLTYIFNKWSRLQDETGDPRIQRRLQILSGPGLVLYGLTVTFASIDWVMSLDPEWFSTIFGILTMGGQGLSALSFVIAVLVLLSDYEPIRSHLKPGALHDLGKLMLAFVMLWAYFAFSQFLIIWAGNLPEEIPWYVKRLEGGWKWVGLMLVLLHFALPFLMLLSRDLKRHARSLIWVAALVIVMRFIDVVWMIAPEFHHTDQLVPGLGFLMDVLVLAGMGGIWLWFYLRQLKSMPILPLHDPNWETAATE